MAPRGLGAGEHPGAAAGRGPHPCERGPDGWRLALVRPRDCPPDGTRYFLGTDRTGAAYFAYATGRLPAPPTGTARVAALDDGAYPLGDRDHGMLVHATALENWHRTHGRCPAAATPPRWSAAATSGAAGRAAPSTIPVPTPPCSC
ncbi:NUDIX-like domain-containing protein [Streptomyces lydicus]|nr:NUDIX-like domain-containing protein [Streptomyces lydicus]